MTKLEAQLERQVRYLTSELDMKASLQSINEIEQTLMTRLNEVVANFDNMYADKEGTRKKIS